MFYLNMHSLTIILFASVSKSFQANLVSTTSVYDPIENTELTIQGQVNSFYSISAKNLMRCLIICSSKPLCLMVRYKENQCELYKEVDCLNITPTVGKILFKRKHLNKIDVSQGLVNHWSFSNNGLDSAGTSHLNNGKGFSFTNDRYCSPRSALSLSNGYYQAPAGVYFRGPFSVTAWIKMRKVTVSARLIDFGTGTFGSNNIVFCVFLDILKTPTLNTFSNFQNSPYLVSNLNITLNVWYHLAATFNGNLGYVYIDGELVASGPLISPDYVNRDLNFIGKSNYQGDGDADGIFDEIRIYNRYLSANQILSLIQS